MSVQGPSPFNLNPLSSRPAASSSSVSPSVAGMLQRSEGLAKVLDGLGIDASRVVQLNTRSDAAALLAESLPHLQLLPVTESRGQVLAALGLTGVSTVISLQAEEELDRIRRKLKDIELTLLDTDLIISCLQALGLPDDMDALVFRDTTGGLLIIQSAMDDISDTL